MTLVFEIFYPIGSLFMSQLNLIDHRALYAEKHYLSLSPLVHEIIGPKVGITFQ